VQAKWDMKHGKGCEEGGGNGRENKGDNDVEHLTEKLKVRPCFDRLFYC